MTTRVNDSYPVSDEALKAQLAEQFATNSLPTTAKYEGPTEVIDLPSRGFFYPEGHPLSSGKIELKYMTAKEEDILASQTLIKQGVVIDKLLQSLIVTKVNYNEILTMDKNAVFIAARILAYGPDYTVEVTCPSCGEKSKYTVDLQEFQEKEIDWTKFTKGKTTNTFELPVSRKTVEFKFLTHGDEKAIEESGKQSAKLAKLTGINTDLTTRLKHLIVSVDGDTNQTNINNFVDNLLSRDSLALRKHIKEMTPDVDTTFTFTCQHCGFEQTNMQLPITVQFFWPGV